MAIEPNMRNIPYNKPYLNNYEAINQLDIVKVYNTLKQLRMIYKLKPVHNG